jgi:addiction module RelE/StbE family toxin
MRIDYHARFKKQYKKLNLKEQTRFQERLEILLVNPMSPELRVHTLKAKYRGYLSMDVTGDIRALYYYEGNTVVVFGFIGTHSQLYG